MFRNGKEGKNISLQPCCFAQRFVCRKTFEQGMFKVFAGEWKVLREEIKLDTFECKRKLRWKVKISYFRTELFDFARETIVREETKIKAFESKA